MKLCLLYIRLLTTIIYILNKHRIRERSPLRSTPSPFTGTVRTPSRRHLKVPVGHYTPKICPSTTPHPSLLKTWALRWTRLTMSSSGMRQEAPCAKGDNVYLSECQEIRQNISFPSCECILSAGCNLRCKISHRRVCVPFPAFVSEALRLKTQA